MLAFIFKATSNPLLELWVKGFQHQGARFLGSSQEQWFERLRFQQSEKLLCGVLEMVVHVLFDASLVARLGPAALVMLTGNEILNSSHLMHSLSSSFEKPSGAAVHQGDAPCA